MAAPNLGRSTEAQAARSPWSIRALLLGGRAALDCAYLVRSRHTRRNKVRILLEYMRLTIRLLLGADPAGARSERVLGYRIRHFGGGSLQLLFREIFVRNDYFFETTAGRPFIVDCGANIGLATIFFKWLYPRSEIHAFEPDPETFAVLKENVEQNALADVHLYNVALCETDGSVDFFVPQGAAGSLMMSLVPGRVAGTETRRIVVDGRVLSPYVEGREVDFLKMDIEGGEQGVLSELARSGALRRVKAIVVEYHHNMQPGSGGLAEFLKLFQDSGYRYNVDARRGAPAEFQDILICAALSDGGSGRDGPVS